MSDRTESLLAELVELHRRQISNQEQALARQEHAISVQQLAVDRQQSALRRLWLLLIIVAIAAVGLPIFSWAFAWLRFLLRS